MTGALVESSKVKRKLYRKFKQNPSQGNENIYREYCKVYQRTSRAAKSEFYEKKLERYANNVKETWKILRAAIGHNKKGGHNFPSYFYDKVNPRVTTAHSGGGPGVGGDDECASAHPSSLPPPGKSPSPSVASRNPIAKTTPRAVSAFCASEGSFFFGFSILLAVIKPNSSLSVSIVKPRS